MTTSTAYLTAGEIGDADYGSDICALANSVNLYTRLNAGVDYTAESSVVEVWGRGFGDLGRGAWAWRWEA